MTRWLPLSKFYQGLWKGLFPFVLGIMGLFCDQFLHFGELTFGELSLALGLGLALHIAYGAWFSLVLASFLFAVAKQSYSPVEVVLCVFFYGLHLHLCKSLFHHLWQSLRFASDSRFLLAAVATAALSAGIQGLSAAVSTFWAPASSYSSIRDFVLASALGGALSVLLGTTLFLRVMPPFREPDWSPRACARSVWISVLVLAVAYWGLNWFEGLLFVCFASLLVASASLKERQLGSLVLCLGIMGLGMFVARTAEEHALIRSGDVQTVLHVQIFALLMVGTTLTVQGLKSLGEVRLPALTLLGGWLVQFIVAVGFYKTETALNHERFEAFVRENSSRIEARFKTYSDGLLGAAALLKTLGDQMQPMEPHYWKSFVDAMELEAHYPGIRGVALIRRVPDDRLEAFLQAARKVIPGFEVRDIPGDQEKPPGAERFVVANIEPFERNRRALGINLASEANRKEAAVRAADTRKPAVTKRIMLVQDSEKRAGLLYYLPVYDAGRNTGWVNVPLTTDEFFRNISYVGAQEVGFTAHFLGDEDFTLFQSFAWEESVSKNPERTHMIELAQQPFVFRWYTLKGFSNAHDTAASWVSFAIGVLTLILAIFLAHLQLIRKNAERLAEEIASDRDHHRSIAFQAAKMSLVGEMAGGIAHEINNPLSVIAVSAQQIKRTLTSRDESDPLLPKLDKISTTVERITKIVQGLRTFSRSGEKLPASTCSLHSLVHGVLDLCRERFYHHNIEILLDPIPTVNLQVVEVQIEQVLMNLLSNSFDAIQGSEKPWVKISFELLADRIHIRVTDSGSGISEAIRDRLMQPFFTTKEVGKGTGLGLSISKGIMESHGGSLLLDRESFHTSFVMILPLVALKMVGK